MEWTERPPYWLTVSVKVWAVESIMHCLSLFIEKSQLYGARPGLACRIAPAHRPCLWAMLATAVAAVAEVFGVLQARWLVFEVACVAQLTAYALAARHLAWLPLLLVTAVVSPEVRRAAPLALCLSLTGVALQHPESALFAFALTLCRLLDDAGVRGLALYACLVAANEAIVDSVHRTYPRNRVPATHDVGPLARLALYVVGIRCVRADEWARAVVECDGDEAGDEPGGDGACGDADAPELSGLWWSHVPGAALLGQRLCTRGTALHTDRIEHSAFRVSRAGAVACLVTAFRLPVAPLVRVVPFEPGAWLVTGDRVLVWFFALPWRTRALYAERAVARAPSDAARWARERPVAAVYVFVPTRSVLRRFVQSVLAYFASYEALYHEAPDQTRWW